MPKKSDFVFHECGTVDRLEHPVKQLVYTLNTPDRRRVEVVDTFALVKRTVREVSPTPGSWEDATPTNITSERG